MYYNCEKCHLNYREDKVEECLMGFIYDLVEYDMAVKKYFYPLLADHKPTKTNDIEKDISKLEKQKERIKKAYSEGIVELDDFAEDYKIIEEKLEILEQKKNESLDLDNITFSSQQLMADRDIERETLIRLDKLNDTVKNIWNNKTKEEKQEFISKFIESVILTKDKKNNLQIKNLNFRSSYISILKKLVEKGVFDVLVPIKINGKETYILGTPNINNEQVEEYLDRLNEYFEIKLYKTYEKINEKTGNMIGEIYLNEDEKIIRILPINSTKTTTKSKIIKENLETKYGIVTYNPTKPNKKLLEI